MDTAAKTGNTSSRRLLRLLSSALPSRRKFKRTPTILQMEAAECGAASLAMVFAFHGLWVPLEQIRVACGVSRDGSKASNILRAARRFGFASSGYRKEPTSLNDLVMPCIIHWNFNHFVVLEGINDQRAQINDPAFGRRRVDLTEFDSAFTGVALELKPAAEFVKAGKKPNGLRVFVNELRRSREAVALLIVLSFALVFPGIIIPAFSKIFVDDILIQHADEWFVPLLIGMAITAIARALILALQQSVLLRLETKLSVTMMSRFLMHVLALPMEFFSQRHAGDIAYRVGINDVIARMLSSGVASNSLNLISLLFYAAIMLLYDLPLAAIGIGLSLVNVLIMRMVRSRRADLSRTLALEQGRLQSSTIGLIRTIETLKSNGLENEAFAHWTGTQAKALNAEQDLGVYSTMLEAVPTLLGGLTVAAVLGVGGMRVIDGAITLGTLVAFQSLMSSFSAPIAQLVQLADHLQLIKGGVERIEDVYNYPLDGQNKPPQSARLERLVGRIELVDVEFGYSILEPPLIRNLSICVEAGQRVAIVGISGSGKSTIGRLICGLYKPWSGEIRVDGRNLAEIPPHVFAHSVSYVDQDIFLFEGTVRENLTLWDPTVSEANLAGALKDAHIHEEIASRPGNYDCYVSEGGTNFSGGERQRIEIARALSSNPSLLLLDEATASLDPVVEKAIDDGLRCRGCTCIIIAHRLSTIRDCDEILMLQNGQVAERGRHEDLMALGGAYARMVSQE
jgi:NHLM bacteriocin system ABC transporter peptidase/ATP-binding protein